MFSMIEVNDENEGTVNIIVDKIVGIATDTMGGSLIYVTTGKIYDVKETREEIFDKLTVLRAEHHHVFYLRKMCEILATLLDQSMEPSQVNLEEAQNQFRAMKSVLDSVESLKGAPNPPNGSVKR